jgi:hypothetical protein
MEFAFSFVFLLLAALGFVEVLLSRNWNLAYFKSGFPVFRACRQAATEPLISVDTVKLESLLPKSKQGKLQFRKVTGNLYVFREEYLAFPDFRYTGIGWYCPIMHGNLIIDQAREQIEVIGRLNWFPLIFGPIAPVALLLVSWPLDWLLFIVWAMLAFVYVASAVSYLVQKKRFDQVADLVAKM